MLSVGSITASQPSLLLPRDGCNAAALTEWKGISFVTVHHHHPPCRQQPQVCPRISAPTLIVPRSPHRHQRVEKPPPQDSRFKCAVGASEGRRRRKVKPGKLSLSPPSHDDPWLALPAGRVCTEVTVRFSRKWESGRGGWGGIRVTSGSLTLNKE